MPRGNIDTQRDTQRRLDSLMVHVREKELPLLIILLAAVYCIAGIVIYRLDHHAFLYFGDAASHIVRARQFFDSQRPGFHNIGTVWLPLPHLILLPLVAFDALFYSGIAGPMIGIPCLVGTALLLFLMVRRITGSPAVAFLSACLFGLNPNLVYMALTPMNETILLFLVAFGGYAMMQWHVSGRNVWLWTSAAAVVLACLCRYEAWLLVPLLSLICGAQGRVLWQRGERAASARLFAIAGVCWLGIAFWLSWNYAEYHDPLFFSRWTYAVAAGHGQANIRQAPLDVLAIFGTALLVIFGPVLLLTALWGALPFPGTHSAQLHRGLLLLFLGLPAVFALAAILAGFVQVDHWRWNWRYVLTASLFLSVAAGMGISRFSGRVHSALGRSVGLVSLFAMPLVQLLLPDVGVATFDDARRSVNDETRFAVVAGEHLRGIYTDGSIALLTGYGQAQRLMLSSGLPLKQFHIMYNPAEQDILGSLEHSERYLVIAKDRTVESAQFIDSWLSRRDELLRYYTIRFENGHHILLERLPSPASPAIEHPGRVP